MTKKREISGQLRDAFDVVEEMFPDVACIAAAKPKRLKKYARGGFGPIFQEDATAAKKALLDLVQTIVNAEARLIAAKGDDSADGTILPFKRISSKRTRVELR